MSEFDGLPALRNPVVVAAFEGWNDAADAATAAVEHLELVWGAHQIAEIDPDDYYDFQVTRPVVNLAEGQTRSIEWPTTRFFVASPPEAERDVILVRGIEPNMRWRAFCQDILEMCHSLEATQVVLLGALLADVPHTRPLPVSGSASDTALIERLRLSLTRYEGPTGIVGVLHDACIRAEVDAVSFWAHVPHYASQPPCGKATLALLHHVEEVLDIPVAVGDLAEDAALWEESVNKLIEQDTDLIDYVRSLEERDTDELQPLSGDEIAREFEKYLRRRGSGGGAGPTLPSP